MFGSNFGNNQTSNMFGSNNQPTGGFFNSPQIISTGTVNKFTPTIISDNLTKSGQNITIQGRIHSISAMKEYETKSFEELRCEDYQAGRFTGTNQNMFGNNATSNFNTPTNNFGAFGQTMNQPNQQLFNNPVNNFGATKPLFGTGINTTPTNAFTTSAQNKPNMFNTNQNKPMFGAAQTPGNTLFNAPNNQQNNTVFGQNTFNNTSTAQNSFFNKPQTTQTSLFGNQNAINTSSSFNFGGNPQPASTQNTLFGAQALNNKPFGQTSNFGINSTNTSTGGTALFGNNAVSTGNNYVGLFGQQATSQPNTGFGLGQAASKPGSLFSTTNTFSTAQPLQTSSSLFQNPTANAFGTQNTSTASNLFGAAQPKPFGTTNNVGGSLFGSTANTQQAGLFNTNTNIQPFGGLTNQTNAIQPFGTNTGTIGGAFNQPLANNNSLLGQNATNVVSTVSPLGYNDPNEALMQQKLSQAKFLNMVGNRPYGVTRLFLGVNGQDFNSSSVEKTSADVSVSNKNSNLSLAIKRSDLSQNQHRKRFNNTVQSGKGLQKLFSGFDEEETYETQSNKSSTPSNFDKNFFTKRENWKYLPPNAFDKSRKSANASTNSLLNDSMNKRNNNIPQAANGIMPNFTVSNGDTVIQSTVPNYSTPISNSMKKANFATSPVVINDSTAANDSLNTSVSFSTSVVMRGENGTNKQGITYEDYGKAGDSNVNSVLDNVEDSDDTSLKCGVVLAKTGYYIAPEIKVLNDLVTENDDGEYECWVKDLIIGRKDYGSIRFSGYTNVYALNLDDLVEIKRAEVSVYPDETSKPEIGEGINKRAQVVLHKVYPKDKVSGESITDTKTLIETKFEIKLQRACKKMDSTFISYNPLDGLWIFEVEHFSKYKYDDSDDEDDIDIDNEMPSAKTQIENNNVQYNVADSTSNQKKQFLPIVKSEEISRPNVISAEADSMTDGVMESQPKTKLPSSNSLHFQRMRQTLAFTDDDDDNGNSVFKFTNNNKSVTIKRDMDEPAKKRFETIEMGQYLFDQNRYGLQETSDYDELSSSYIPISVESLAPTKPFLTNFKQKQDISISSSLRQITDLNQFYILDLFNPILDEMLGSSKTQQFHYLQNEIFKSNQFRVHVSFSPANGLKMICPRSYLTNFPRINNAMTIFSDTKSKFNAFNGNITNGNYSDHLVTISSVIKTDSNIDIQRKCLEILLEQSTIEKTQDFPNISVNKGLVLLNKLILLDNGAFYKDKLGKFTKDTLIWRELYLINALWGDFSENDRSYPDSINYVCRKQALSNWLRRDNRYKLSLKLALYKSKKLEDVSELILEALCSGEIELAMRICIANKYYRLGMVIGQVAGNKFELRDLMKEQLLMWYQSRIDVFMSPVLLKCYTLLSGQTYLPLSDGNVIYVFENMSWTQTLGCFIWYLTPAIASINTALKLYESHLESELYIPAPLPIDLLQVDYQIDADQPIDLTFTDCCYPPIQLFCQASNCSLNKLLNPSNVSTESEHRFANNWFESWLTSSVLQALLDDDYLQHKSDLFNIISVEFAHQLERNYMPEWACFVLASIKNDYLLKKSTIQPIIQRNISLIWDKFPEFISERLNYNSKCIYAAQAILARYLNKTYMEAEFLLMSGELDLSLQLYTSELIPNWIINDRFNEVREVLERFVKLSGSSSYTLTEWNNGLDGGEIYLGYLTVVNELNQLKLTNKLMDYSIIAMDDADEDEDEEQVDKDVNISRCQPMSLSGDELISDRNSTLLLSSQNNSRNVDNKITNKLVKIKYHVDYIQTVLNNYSFDTLQTMSNEKRICYNQMQSVVDSFMNIYNEEQVDKIVQKKIID